MSSNRTLLSLILPFLRTVYTYCTFSAASVDIFHKEQVWQLLQKSTWSYSLCLSVCVYTVEPATSVCDYSSLPTLLGLLGSLIRKPKVTSGQVRNCLTHDTFRTKDSLSNLYGCLNVRSGRIFIDIRPSIASTFFFPPLFWGIFSRVCFSFVKALRWIQRRGQRYFFLSLSRTKAP